VGSLEGLDVLTGVSFLSINSLVCHNLCMFLQIVFQYESVIS
jgi:hypothetical protein